MILLIHDIHVLLFSFSASNLDHLEKFGGQESAKAAPAPGEQEVDEDLHALFNVWSDIHGNPCGDMSQ